MAPAMPPAKEPEKLDPGALPDTIGEADSPKTKFSSCSSVQTLASCASSTKTDGAMQRFGSSKSFRMARRASRGHTSHSSDRFWLNIALRQPLGAGLASPLANPAAL